MTNHAFSVESTARVLDIEGTFNVRDPGGYPTATGRVRAGVLLRAGNLHRLTDRGRRQLQDLGIRSIIDLRRPMEVAAEPGPFAEGETPRSFNLPLVVDEPGFLGQPPPFKDVYRSILDRFQPQFHAVFACLAQPEALPALIHCTAGKDRTGLVVALLLDLVGVPHPTIIADYSLSEQILAEAPGFAHHRRQAIDAGRSAYLGAPADLMADTLAYLGERYGHAEGYLRASGLGSDRIERLRNALLERGDNGQP